MRRASSLVAVLTLAALGLAASAPARARPGTNSPFPPATAAERNQTRPLVSVALGALRDGDFGAICGVMSQRWLTADFGSRDRCRRLAASHPTRPCKSCDYTVRQVAHFYRTAADRRLKLRTVVWLFTVEGDPQFKGQSELDLNFRKERGRWRLDNMTLAGSGR